METALIKREKDFIELWAEELRQRDQTLLSKELFPQQAKLIVKNILEAGQALGEHVTSDDFSSIAKVLQVVIVLQEKQITSEEIIHYLESLQAATKKAFPDKKSKDIESFQKILTYLLTFIQNQYSNELLLKESIYYLEQKVDQNILSMIGSSKTITTLIKEMKPILSNDVTVLIEGETGTGKELMARAIYTNSKFNEGPFIALNCAAIPEDLMESEIFGYKKGSFTDATTDKPGKLELANNGILFLDEIYELSPKLQAKLLRVIQEKTVTRLGESKERKINMKLICSSNKNLKNLVEEGKFREDFYYRIAVYRITLPPLRERQSDILPLAQHFLVTRTQEFGKTIRGFSKEAIGLLSKYPWPGNVREVDNVITRAVLKTEGETVQMKDLDIYMTIREPLAHEEISLKGIEKQHIQALLKKNDGNMLKTSKELGITRTTLYNKLKEYDL